MNPDAPEPRDRPQHLQAADRFDLAGLSQPVAIDVHDYHTAGEPFRIITGGIPLIPGDRVLDRRAWVAANLDGVRRLVVNEPRGHADMYGAFVVPPDGPDESGVDAAFGTVFFHKDGYSTACGHGTIALATWAIDVGIVTAPADGEVHFAIDVPSGRVGVTCLREHGRTVAVRFANVPAWVVGCGIPVATSRGQIAVDISYGGAFYASARAGDLGLSIDPRDLSDLIELGREIKWALNDHRLAQHPSDDRLSGMYGTIWWQDEAAERGRFAQRNVTIFADGEVDRSPCGSGTSARLALLAADGLVSPERPLEHRSIVDTRFIGRILGQTTTGGPDGPVPAVLTEVEGRASRTGVATFTLAEDDEVGLGFQLRSEWSGR